MNKQSFTEVFWIIGAMLISLITVVALIGNASFEDIPIEFKLYKTTISVDPWIILFSFFIFLLLITYLIKEGLKKFSDIVANIILALILIGNIIIISYITNLLSVSHIYNVGWTLNPPLSTLPLNQVAISNSFILLIRLLLCFQFVLAAGLLILGIKTGTMVNRRVVPTPGWRS